MNLIKYPQGKYDGFFLIVLIFCVIVAIGMSYFKGLDANLIFATLFIYHIVNGVYKTKTHLLVIKGGVIQLDRGMFNRKIILEIANIKSVDSFELNHEIIKIIFSLQDGKQVDYSPPVSQRQSSECCAQILGAINETLNHKSITK